MKSRTKLFNLISFLILVSLACSVTSSPTETPTTALSEPTTAPTATQIPTDIPLPPPTEAPVSTNPNEPIFVSGTIEFTSPFFLSSVSTGFVMLEDQAGFVARNLEFEFPLGSQTIGPIELIGDDTLTYSLSLPAAPQGTLVDVDNDGGEDTGVMIFAVAYWSNTWGGPFLEPRDGTGWSGAYASTIVDSERDGEIVGGTLIVWSPDDQQQFPVGYGPDNMLFTEDDPVEGIGAGYNIVEIGEEPFFIYKIARPVIDLIEGEMAVNDFSEMGYGEAFDAMFDKVSVEYPFTADKGIDWDALYAEFGPQAANARNTRDYYIVLRDFTLAIPDGHVGVSFDAQVFYEEQGGGFGLVVVELSDGRVIVTQVLPGLPGEAAGFRVGAEIVTWNGQPVLDALRAVEPYFGPYSTEQHKRVEQAIFLTRVPLGGEATVSFKNPGGSVQTVTMASEVDYDSLFAAMPSFLQDEIMLPVQGEVLDESGLGYLQINTFLGDYNLMAQTWEHYIAQLIEFEVPGLIIDLRTNFGGSGGMASAFAGYFFNQEIILGQRSYYNEISGQFEDSPYQSRIVPGPMYYDGPIVLLVSPYCISACEGFANAMIQNGRATVVGHYGTAGAYGEVGRGQYEMPGGYSMQFPTGRSETPDGQLLIEGTGVQPDLVVPVTVDSALGRLDAVLETGIEHLLDIIR